MRLRSFDRTLSSQCVGLQLVPPTDSATIVKWNVQDKRPVALMVSDEEMWEARVDYVFASLKDDPEFIKLTYMAK